MKFSLWKNEATFPRRRLIGEWLIVLILALLTAGAAAFTNAGKQASFWAFDHELAWLTPPVDPKILIVQIDEASLADVGRWPWPRQVHADLIDRLNEGGAAIVGYDVLFIEPDTANDDAALAAALQRSGRVVLPAYTTIPGTNGRDYDLQLPLAQFAKAARGVGHVNVVFDTDGQVRRGQLRMGDGSEELSHMAPLLARLATPKSGQMRQEMIIPYNRIGSFPSIAASQLLRGEVPVGVLENRIVLVGATALGLGDVLSVPGPTGSVMPGVEVQANMLNAILTQSGISDTGELAAFILAAVLMVLIMLAYWWASPTAGLVATVTIGVLAISVSALTLIAFRVWISPVPLLAGVVIAYPLWNWRRLSALNRFVEYEARALDMELDLQEFSGSRTFGFDSVARSASRLRAVIGELGGRRRFLQDVVEGAPDALTVVDADGKVIVTNNTALQLLGREAYRAGIWDELTKSAPIFQLDEKEVELTDGRTMLIKSAPLPGKIGEAPSFIVRIIDITVRREIERQRNEFLEFLSHDMRAPQSNILRIVDLASGNPEQPVPLRRIRDYAETSLKLADDFVQLARLSVLTPQISTVDLRSIAEEAIDRCFDAAQVKKVRIELQVIGDCVLIEADPWLLMRALGNLLDNAIKYSPEGDIVFVDLFVSQSVSNGRGKAVCEIRDSGPGIAPDRLAALFDRFGPNDVTRGLSAGLGLAFVKKAMDLQAAEITCNSGNSGTTFGLTFALSVEQYLLNES